MSESKKIKTALISVYHKDGLDAIIAKLHEEGVQFLSTGGTRQFIESLGYPCLAVEDITTYPSILGGRVKTLHPKIFGGILCRRELESDRQQVEQYEIPEIDLVIVDLYPFEATVASGASEQDIIEKIDIGGISLIRAAAKNFNDVVIDLVIVDLYPFEATVASGASEQDIIEKIDIGGISLIRAAAKNFNDVVIVASKEQYPVLQNILNERGAVTTRDERKALAREAFGVSSHYDTAIHAYFAENTK